MKTLFTAATIFALATIAPAQAEHNMKAFPAAEKGMARHVLQLPEQADESLLKVELIIGKTVQTDKDNRYFYGGKIEAQTISGWGYTRYTVQTLGPMAGTLMAADPNAAKVNRFIPIGGAPYLIGYNSRLPVVVYVPLGAEVRYRIWRTKAETQTVRKG